MFKNLNCKICGKISKSKFDDNTKYFICSSECYDKNFFNNQKSKNQKIIKFKAYLEEYPDKEPNKYYSPIEMKIGCACGEFNDISPPPGIKFRRWEVTMRDITNE